MPGLTSGMAFSFDSPFLSLPVALLLLGACLAAWAQAARARADIRINLRFAAALMAALGAAQVLGAVREDLVDLPRAVAVIAASLGTIAIALSLFAALGRPLPQLPAALALGLSLLAGLGAALSAEPAYAFGCQLAGIALTAAACFSTRKFRTAFLSALAMLALLCGGLCLMDGSANFALLFFAAALLLAARGSQTLVEPQARTNRLFAVSGSR